MKKIRRAFRRKLKQLSYPVTCRLFLFMGFLVRKMDLERSRRLALKLGIIAFDFLRIRRSLVINNLSAVFPEKSRTEVIKTARKVYQNQVLNVIELLRMPLIKDIFDARQLVELDHGNFFQKTRERNKGAVVLSAHLGSWEMLGLCTGLLLGPIHVVAKPLKNTHLDAHLTRWRTMHGNKLLDKDRALREGLKVLRQGGIVGILGDQSNRKGDYFVDFLGRKTTIFLGPAFLALKADVPVFLETCKRLSDGRYKLELIEVKTHDLECTRQDIRTLVHRYTKILEDFIRSHPEEWLWLHDRWKVSPDHEPEKQSLP